MARAGWSQAPDDDAAAMYLETLERTDAAGYAQYEISNVALPGQRCRHNLKYWQDGAWLGFGCGAHSTRAGSRWRNVAETGATSTPWAADCSPWPSTGGSIVDEQVGDMLVHRAAAAGGHRPRSRAGAVRRGRHGAATADRWRAFSTPDCSCSSPVGLRLTRPGMLLANEVMATFV